ncbi:MAG: flagellar motor switch protein FliG [Thermoleophilia bacterium]|nr:flagellar motor switch protein FliG [Thermoleophilia bacterium]
MSKIDGRRKAAILCVSLGASAAAEILRHLDQESVEELTIEMAKTREVEPELAEQVFDEVIELAYARGFIAGGGLYYAREVLAEALGEERADAILAKLGSAVEMTPFDFARRIPPEQIYAFLRGESSQTIALVVANLPSTELAAKVLQQLPPERQAEVALRIAQMGQTSPAVVKDVAAVMKKKLDLVVHQEYAIAGGVQSVAQILNSADRATERNILDGLARDNPELADEVRSLLFVFEDILKLDNRSIQLILKEVDTKDLALALRGASDDLKDAILANMSQRAGEMLREEMEIMPPQRRRVVEEAQSKIVAVVRRLEDAGQITIARGGDEEELIG